MENDAPAVGTPEPDLERIGSTLFNDVLERFVAPEMTRRETDGDGPAGSPVYRFQVLFPPDAPLQVRLNDEVGGEALVKAARPLVKGQEITTDDIAGIEAYIPLPRGRWNPTHHRLRTQRRLERRVRVRLPPPPSSRVP